MNRYALLLLISFLIAGCVQESGYSPVTPTIIAKGDLTGNGKEGITKQTMVISDSMNWNQLLSKMNPVRTLSGSFISSCLEQNIDFSQYTVLAIFDEIRHTGGYTIDINIIEDARNVYVQLVYKIPSGSIVPMIVTQPYLIVKIPKTSKTIQFSSI